MKDQTASFSFLFQCCREAEASVPSLCGSHCEEHCSVTRKQQWRRERLAPCTWNSFPSASETPWEVLSLHTEQGDSVTGWTHF